MPRTLLTALCALSLLAVSAIGAEAAKRSACQRLSGNDRAPARNVKLVKRPSSGRRLDDGARATRLVGCVLPRGRVRAIAYRQGVENDLAQEFSFAVRQVAGAIVLLDQSGSEGGYQSVTTTSVWNLAGGRSYTVARRCYGKDVPCGGDGAFSAPVAYVTSAGRAVAALGRLPAGPQASLVDIASFAPDGTRSDLDVGHFSILPSRSLALNGDIATWTNAGRQRSADIGVSSAG